jgi:hypothetical protein
MKGAGYYLAPCCGRKKALGCLANPVSHGRLPMSIRGVTGQILHCKGAEGQVAQYGDNNLGVITPVSVTLIYADGPYVLVAQKTVPVISILYLLSFRSDTKSEK